MSETPENLAVHILEEVLCWPGRGNHELLADCTRSLSKGKKLSERQAHDYLVRAIKLAKDQGIEVNRMFFMNGEYTNVRPPKPERTGSYVHIDSEAVRAEQGTAEWEEASARARLKLREICWAPQYRQRQQTNIR